MIADWFATLDMNSLLIGLFAGLMTGLAVSLWAARRAAARETVRLQPLLNDLQLELKRAETALVETSRQAAVLETRLEEQQKHFALEKSNLEAAEKRLTEAFERLAGKVFDERSRQFTELSEKQLASLLKPLGKDLETFRGDVDKTHKEDIRQHAELREKLKQMETLNLRLHEDAKNLTRALTRDVKAQGNWGEQQLERLLELAGLVKGENFYTQYSVMGKDGQRLQPDFVLLLPEGRSIILDSKVSLTDWTLYQSAEEGPAQEACLNRHIQSIKSHIDGLSNKNYPAAEELNALDFVLMFVPIEAALIAALQRDSTLPEYALKHHVALLSPSNFLATLRTVASVWQVHKQNTHAQQIAERAGLLYDKFVGFAENLKLVKQRMDQARAAFGKAYAQLADGPGNLVGQVEKLSHLGAKHAKKLEAGLVDKALESAESEDEISAATQEDPENQPDDARLRLVKPEED